MIPPFKKIRSELERVPLIGVRSEALMFRKGRGDYRSSCVFFVTPPSVSVLEV